MISEDEKIILEKMGILFLSSSKLIEKEKIGTGGQGKVLKGYYMDIPVAIKKYKDFDFNHFLREIRIIKIVRHPFVPQFIGINLCKYSNTSYKVSLVTELVNGETFEKYIKIKKPSNVVLLLHMIDLASIISYCHGINLIHRDLKPSNIMIDRSMNLKLLDFGISKFSDKSLTNTEIVGSIQYMAPECFQITDEENCEISINNKCDVWAYGLILYSLFSKENLYDKFENNMQIQSFLINKKDYPVDKNKIDNFKISQICEQCTKSNRNERPDMNIIKKQLISALYDEIKSIWVDINDLIGKVDSESKFFIFRKIETHLKDFLKIAPDLQIKSLNKMETIFKNENVHNKIILKKIINNLNMIKDRADTKNPNSIKLRKSNNNSRIKEDEEERRKKFDIKMSQIAYDSESSSDYDSNLEEESENEWEDSSLDLENKIQIDKKNSEQRVYSEVNEMFGYMYTK